MNKSGSWHLADIVSITRAAVANWCWQMISKFSNPSFCVKIAFKIALVDSDFAGEFEQHGFSRGTKGKAMLNKL